MILRRITQVLLATTLALAGVFGIAGIAAAAFTPGAPAQANLSVSSLTLQPATNLAVTCKKTTPTVTFTPSSSRDVVDGRSQSLGYQWTFANPAKPGSARSGSLTASDTHWTGPKLGKNESGWTFSITTTYATWTSAPATIPVEC